MRGFPSPERVLVLPSLPRNPLEGDNIKTRRWRSKAYPLPHGVSPVSVPLIAMQQGIHGKPCGFRHKTGFKKSLFCAAPLYGRGHSRSRSAGAFPNCVTRFRGGALRHAKFPKTSYKVQLLDTRLHAACVSLNRGRRRGLIFLSKKVLVPLGKTRAFCRARVIPRTPFFVIPSLPRNLLERDLTSPAFTL